MPLSRGGSRGWGMGLVSDRKPAVAAGPRERRPRLKREEYTHVKHDSSFSAWKVLVGPSDWKEHAAGKTPDRFQVGNLPSNYEGPGIYELGVTPPAWLPRNDDDSGVLKSQDVVVVYLGCADNVCHHLQRFGQTGAHLEGARSTRLFAATKNEPRNPSSSSDTTHCNLEKSPSSPSDHERNTSLDRASSTNGDRGCGGGDNKDYVSTRSSNASMSDFSGDFQAMELHKKTSSFDCVGQSRSLRGPRLFSEVFALGCSVAFRWAATDSRLAAERAETELMRVFDYAYKRGGNFRQRSPDILAKIVKGAALGPSSDSFCFKLNDPSDRTYLFFFKKTRVGIHIAAKKLPDPRTGPSHRRSSASDPRRVYDFFTLFNRTSASAASPSALKSSKCSEFTKLDIPLDRCGVLLETGLHCSALPGKGSRRCLKHKDMKKGSRPARVANTNQCNSPPSNGSSKSRTQARIQPSSSSSASPASTTSSSSCFPFSPSPSPAAAAAGAQPTSTSSEQHPNKRPGSLSFTSWLRTSELRLRKSTEWGEMAVIRADGARQSGTFSKNGSFLATCEEISACSSPPCRSPSRREICGLRLADGTVCPDPPRTPQRKRCEAHKGLRNQAPRVAFNQPGLLFF